MTNSVLAKLAVQISANTAEFNRALSSTQKNLSTFTTGLTKLAGAAGVAFGIKEIAGFGLEVSKLAGEADGVRAAFSKLPASIKLLEDLKSATGDTVSELELMKRSVQASNFDISLKALPDLLKFATVRAQQTGQSVDYLVDSIVTGIGRKSKLILDNLGISAVQLGNKLKGVGTESASVADVAKAVGEIAAESLKTSGDIINTNSTKLQQLSASWENVKVAIGDAANSTGILGNTLDAITGSLNTLASKDLSFFEKITAFLGGPTGLSNASVVAYIRMQERMKEEQKKNEQVIREVDRAYKEFNGNIDAYGKAISTHIYRTELLAEFQKRLTAEQDAATESARKQKEEMKKLAEAQQKVAEAMAKRLDAQALLKDVSGGMLDKQMADEQSQAMASSPDAMARGLKANGLIDMEAFDTYLSNARRMLAVTKQTTTQVKAQWLDMSGAITGALVSVSDGLGQAIAGVGDFGDVVLKALAGFARQIGESLIAIGVGMLAARQAIKNPYFAIAAGVALVALSGYMTASMNKAQSNFNSGSVSSGGGGYAARSVGEFNRGSSSAFTGSSNSQDNNPKLVAVLKGQDIWITLQNYQQGNNYTRAI